MDTAESRFKDLKNLGIKRVGSWVLSDDKSEKGEPFNIALDLDENPTNVVYFYVINDELKYQGKCDRTLRERIGEVRAGPQSYCKRGGDKAMNLKIRDELTSGKIVDIYAYIPPKKLVKEKHLGEVIEVWVSTIPSKNIEKALNKRFKPEWNRQT